MSKTEMLHVRINPKLKEESEIILDRLGVNTSYAINMFLQQLVYEQGFPFDLKLPNKLEIERAEKLAYAINLTGGKEPSPHIKRIIHLFAQGDIDYETAIFAIKRNLINA